MNEKELSFRFTKEQLLNFMNKFYDFYVKEREASAIKREIYQEQLDRIIKKDNLLVEKIKHSKRVDLSVSLLLQRNEISNDFATALTKRGFQAGYSKALNEMYKSFGEYIEDFMKQIVEKEKEGKKDEK